MLENQTFETEHPFFPESAPPQNTQSQSNRPYKRDRVTHQSKKPRAQLEEEFMPLVIEDKDEDDVVHFIYGNSLIPEYPVVAPIQPEPVLSWSAYEAHMPQYPVV